MKAIINELKWPRGIFIAVLSSFRNGNIRALTIPTAIITTPPN